MKTKINALFLLPCCIMRLLILPEKKNSTINIDVYSKNFRVNGL